MDEQRTVFVGIDVSKGRLDVHLRPSGKVFWVSRETQGLDDLVSRLLGLPVALVVLEATGGFELTVAAALASVGLLISVVNPPLVAVMRKLITILNAILRDNSPWHDQNA